MVPRNLGSVLERLAGHYPVVTVTGPRQSGKTTLCRATFPDRRYVSLEPLDTREYARSDPRGFLAEHLDGAVIDEVQHAPGLLTYLQEEVDRDATPGRFVLTGSQHFGLSQAIAESLAGRTAVVQLLPLGLDELRQFPGASPDLWTTLWAGSYPRIHDRGIPADRWLADYVTTYVQRDVRQVLAVGDLTAFSTFLRLVGGRTAQELNLSDLGADAGVSHNTARSWLSVLETSFLCHRLPAWHRNLRKQLVKAPKLHMVDSGLACWLIGIRSPEDLRHHPLRGAIFETWVAAEVLKARLHRGLDPRLFHFRESRGIEVDLLLERDAGSLIAVEAKSGATFTTDFLRSLDRFEALLAGGAQQIRVDKRVVFGGDSGQRRTGATVLAWGELLEADWG